jgi:hypothetical protein
VLLRRLLQPGARGGRVSRPRRAGHSGNCPRDMQHNPLVHLYQRGSEESEGPRRHKDA